MDKITLLIAAEASPNEARRLSRALDAVHPLVEVDTHAEPGAAPGEIDLLCLWTTWKKPTEQRPERAMKACIGWVGSRAARVRRTHRLVVSVPEIESWGRWTSCGPVALTHHRRFRDARIKRTGPEARPRRGRAAQSRGVGAPVFPRAVQGWPGPAQKRIRNRLGGCAGERAPTLIRPAPPAVDARGYPKPPALPGHPAAG